MRMSCNGCRVLRKGCSEDCSIRPCLQWIKSPDAQGNATVFLAKFYGRAGLLNLINAGPEHLRPAIFRSLLYEACGRVVNPIYGSVGLLWSGSWHLCQAAVDSVLKGAPIMQISTEAAAAASSPMPALKAFDIRHVPKGSPESELHRVGKPGRSRFKRSGCHKRDAPAEKGESSGSHSQEEHEQEHENENENEVENENENESMVLSEGSMVTSHTEDSGAEEGGEVQLELTLGPGPGPGPQPSRPSGTSERRDASHRWTGAESIWLSM